MTRCAFDALISTDRVSERKVMVCGHGPATVAGPHVEATDRRFGRLPSAAETRWKGSESGKTPHHWFPNWGARTHCWGGASSYYEIKFLSVKLFLF